MACFPAQSVACALLSDCRLFPLCWAQQRQHQQQQHLFPSAKHGLHNCHIGGGSSPTVGGTHSTLGRGINGYGKQRVPNHSSHNRPVRRLRGKASCALWRPTCFPCFPNVLLRLCALAGSQPIRPGVQRPWCGKVLNAFPHKPPKPSYRPGVRRPWCSAALNASYTSPS